MAALQPPVGGLPLPSPATRRSFADVLAAKSSSSSPSSHPYDTDPLKMGLHKGQPAAFFTDSQLQGLSSQYSWSLVGKFSQGFNKQDPKKGRPSLERLHQYFLSLDFKGDFSIGLLDNRHVVIHLSTEMDYLRLYSRMVWYIGSITMRVFRWSPYFRVDKESPLVPVWITMPRLPIMLFEKRTLFSLASLIGHPLRCDEATVHLKRPSVARIQVELDLLKPRPHQIWIGLGESDGYWQRIEYESLPEYCQICWHVGHSESLCHVKHPELKAKVLPEPGPPVGKQPPAPRNNLIYVPMSAIEHEQRESATIVPPLVPVVPQEQRESAAAAPVASLVKSAVAPPVESHGAGIDLHSAVAEALAVGKDVLVPCSGPSVVKPQVCLGSSISEASSPGSQQEDFVPRSMHVSDLVERPAALLDASTSQINYSADDSLPQLAPVTGIVDSSAVQQLTDHSSAVPVTCSAEDHLSPAHNLNLPPQLSSLQATYKNVLLDSSLQGVVAQEIGFPPTAVAELAPEHAIVVYQTDGHTNKSNLVSNATVLPLDNSPMLQFHHAQNRWHSALDTDIGYNDSDYYQETQGSDDLGHEDYDTDDNTYEDITDGSEGTHMKKKKDRQKLKGLASKPLATIDDFTAQSSLIDMRIRKRGRPPGSRNRTYFDVLRTMSTRTTKATSD